MKKYVPVLMKSKLFEGVCENDIIPMLGCLNTELRCYKKDEYVIKYGEKAEYITLLAEGKLHIRRDDYWGNRSILSAVCPGEMFGEAYISEDSTALLNDVVAVEDSKVLFFDVKKLLTVCHSACSFHSMVVKNLFFAISEKNRRLVGKLVHMSQRSTREKLISYLSEEAGRNGSASFEIPFNRQQLADFLSVDRSAMSNELSKMREDGLIIFEKNKFTLLD